MGGITTYGKKCILDHALSSTLSYTPTTAWLAFCTNDPGDDVNGAIANECTETGKGYQRQQIFFGAMVGRTITQSAPVSLPQVTGSDYGAALTHWAIMSAQGGTGKMLAKGKFAGTGYLPVLNNIPTVPTGTIYVVFNAGGGAPSGGGWTNTAVQRALDMLFRGVSWTKPATHVRLCTATLTDASATFTEVTGDNYTPVRIYPNASGTPNWSTVDTSGAPLIRVRNLDDVTMPTPGVSGWPTFVAQCITSGSGGSGTVDVLFYGNDVLDQPAVQNDSVLFPATLLAIPIS